MSDTYTRQDVIRLYDELKDVNPEDYWDEEDNCYYGAFAGPITKESCDIVCEIIHLFDKELFHLWPTHDGYLLSKRKTEYNKEILYGFDIDQDSCVWYIGYAHPKNGLVYGGNRKFSEMTDRTAELTDIINKFNEAILNELKR